MRGAAFACLASLTLTCLAQETKIDLNKSQTFGALPTQVQATGEKGETVKLNILCYEGYVTKKSALEFAQRMKNKFHRNILISFQNIEDEDKIFDSLRSGDHDIISPGIDLYQDERFQLIEKKFLLPIDLDLVSNYKNLFAFRKKKIGRAHV